MVLSDNFLNLVWGQNETLLVVFWEGAIVVVLGYRRTIV